MVDIMEDKRTFERFDLAVPAKIGVEGIDTGIEEMSLVTRDICAGGAFLHTKNPLPEGTRIKMNLVLSIEKLKQLLDSECEIQVEGTVVRSEDTGIAIRFEENYELVSVTGTVH